MSLDEARALLPCVWTIYDHPRDWPQNFVVRRWFGEYAELEFMLCDSLEAARRLVQDDGGSFRIGRESADDPSIAESWI